MKVRNGFVSNSSSSSFIIGVGKIKNYDKFIKYLKSKNIKYEGRILTSTQILERDWGWNPFEVIDNCTKEPCLQVSACTNSSPSVSIRIDPSTEDHYFAVEIGNDEGDAEFWNPNTQELEWDKVNEDYFDGEQAEIIKVLKSNLLERASYRVGAERNG